MPPRQIELGEHQIRGLEHMRGLRYAANLSQFGCGKALPFDSAVLTPSGWIKNGALEIGDFVCDPHGGVARIIEIHDFKNIEIYKIVFDDGTSCEASADHLWRVPYYDPKLGRLFRIVSTRDMLRTGLRFNSGTWKYRIETPLHIDMNETEQEIDPYLLGVIIGDGGTTGGQVILTSADEWIVNECARLLPPGTCMKKGKGKYQYCMKRDGTKPSNPLIDSLRNYGLFKLHSGVKFIPECYKNGSYSQRLAILQGIFDTDGHGAGNGCDYITTSERLAIDVLYVLRSLGGYGKIISKQPVCKVAKNKPALAYRIYASLPPGVNLFRLNRKLEAIKPRKRYFYATRSVVEIQKSRFADARCITLDSKNQLYVTTDFVVTHNSYTLSHRLLDLVPPKRALIVSTSAMVGTRQSPGAWYRTLKRTNPWWNINILTGRREERRKALYSPHHIAMINYEGVLVLGQELIDEGRYQVLGLDEVHRLKGASSAISRAMAAMAKTAEYVYGLTGSPVLESPIDLYGIYRSIYPPLFGDDFYEWRSRYFEFRSEEDEDGHRTYPRWLPKEGAMEILASAVQAISFRVTHDELPWDFPKEVEVEPIYVDIGPKVRAVYDEIMEETSIAMKSGTITAEFIRPKLLKMMQLCSGWIYDDQHRAITVGPCEKAVAFADTISQIRGHPFVVWAVSPPDMTILARTLDRFKWVKYGTIYGATPTGERADILAAFNAGKINGLIAHPQCVGEGVDLESQYDFRFSRTWSANQYSQSRGRCRRANSSRDRVFYADFISRDTIDETIYFALLKKLSYLSLLLKHADFSKVHDAVETEVAETVPLSDEDEILE